MDINLKCDRMLKPDLCIFLDVNPDTCKKRIDEVREKPELYEKDVEKMRSIRNNFISVLGKLSDTHNIAIIDANASIEEIFAKACAEIDNII